VSLGDRCGPPTAASPRRPAPRDWRGELVGLTADFAWWQRGADVRSEAVTDQRVRTRRGGVDKSRLRKQGIGGAAMSCDLRELSRYRVLRQPPRGGGRSVDRDRAGRNAASVKGVEPRQSRSYVVAEQVSSRPGNRPCEGSTGREAGTTGVQDHSMHGRLVTEHLRSARGGVEAQRPWPTAGGQGLRPKSVAIPRAEVRYLHCSCEAGQCPWSEGRYGE